MNFSFEIYQPVARVSLLYFPCVFIVVVVFFKVSPATVFCGQLLPGHVGTSLSLSLCLFSHPSLQIKYGGQRSEHCV